MDILSLKRHLPSIEEGRWITSKEMPALMDVRLQVRGSTTRECRDLMASKLRNVDPREKDAQGNILPEANQRITVELLGGWNLIGIEGLTENGKELTLEDVRERLKIPAYDPLLDLIDKAVVIVNNTRESHVEALAKN